MLKEVKIENLGHFTAYSNKHIKALFDDRTIVRVFEGCKMAKILNKMGEELYVNLERKNLVTEEYASYLKVVNEFFDWVFVPE